MRRILLVLTLLGGFSLSAATAQMSIVVGKDSGHSATKVTAQSMFEGSRLTWPDGKNVLIVDQPNTKTATEFYKLIVGKSEKQVRKQWFKLVLSGQAQNPLKCRDDECVKRQVNVSKNAIGFIQTSRLDSTVKELLRIEKPKSPSTE